MMDFIQKQLDASNRLLEMMAKDHKERVDQFKVWIDMNDSLARKLEERDKEIEHLRSLLKQYETAEKL